MSFVVIACYNKYSVMNALYLPLTVAAESRGEPIKIVDDDGSSEDTWEKLQKIHWSSSHWDVVRFARQFVYHEALSAGNISASAMVKKE